MISPNPKPNNAKKRRPSTQLAAIIGPDPVRWHEAVKSVWAYIKANGLQSQRDGRLILPDAKLGRVTGHSEISSFTLNRYLAEHLISVDG